MYPFHQIFRYRIRYFRFFNNFVPLITFWDFISIYVDLCIDTLMIIGMSRILVDTTGLVLKSVLPKSYTMH